MSEAQVTQAAVDETPASAVPDATVTSARNDDDLDTLLAQYKPAETRPSEPAKPEPKAGEADDVLAAKDEVLAARDEIRREAFTKDMRATIEKVRGDLPSDYFDDKLVQSWIDARASDDPRLAQAWMNRKADPASFNRVVAALGKEFAKKYGKLPDADATASRQAVTAAVRGSSTKAPESAPPDFSGMGNAEYREAHKKQYGYYPNV